MMQPDLAVNDCFGLWFIMVPQLMAYHGSCYVDGQVYPSVLALYVVANQLYS